MRTTCGICLWLALLAGGCEVDEREPSKQVVLNGISFFVPVTASVEEFSGRISIASDTRYRGGWSLDAYQPGSPQADKSVGRLLKKCRKSFLASRVDVCAARAVVEVGSGGPEYHTVAKITSQERSIVVAFVATTKDGERMLSLILESAKRLYPSSVPPPVSR